MSRDAGRADALAAAVGQLERWLRGADVVIGATTAPAPVLTADMLAISRHVATSSADADPAPLLICDLGVPRNVEANVPATLYTIDDIRARRDAALEAREAAVPAARAIMDHAARQWQAWQRARALVPAVVGLNAREQTRRLAMATRLATRTGAPVARLDGRLRRTGRQLLHRHVVALRTGAAGSPGAAGGPASCHVTVQG